MALREKLKNAKESVSGALSNAKQSPDDEAVDQLEARRERARLEAKREKEAELRKQRIQEAREQGREEGTAAATGENNQGVLEKVQSAVNTVAENAQNVDIDGDGESLAEELQDGSNPAGGQGGAFEQDIQALEQEVSQNEREIDRLEEEFGGGDGGGMGMSSGDDPFGGDPFGDEADDLEAMGFNVDDEGNGGLF